MARILVVDDEPVILHALKAGLGARHEVQLASDGVEAKRLVDAGPLDLVITDLRMPDADGFAVLAHVRRSAPHVPVVILTASTSLSDCVEAMRAGAHDFLVKPWDDVQLATVVRRALDGAQPFPRSTTPAPVLLSEALPTNARPSPALPRGRSRPFAGRPQAALIGDSPALREVLSTIEKVAPTDATVLLLGESGTGKEVVARLLHSFSPRVGRPFIAINCGAIPEALVESELFGHTRGAFTGATEARPGRFVEADGGTLFLDEVGDLPLPAQVKLLRVLQERTVAPVGDGKDRAVDVRVVAATNQHLKALVDQKKFRSDLYFRLNVVPVELPALRERRSDIPLLVRYFLEVAGHRHRRDVQITDDAVLALQLASWPGNVRELENLIERLVVLDTRGVIQARDLPASLISGPPAETARAAALLGDGNIDLGSTLDGMERALIEEALRMTGGNKAKAAERLGLSRTTLFDRMKRLGVPG